MHAPVPPYCPYCGQIDQTRKVSGLYAAGAKRFAPPVRPTRGGCLSGCFEFALLLLVLLTGSCGLLGLLVWHLVGNDSLPLVTLAVSVPLLALLAVGSIALAWRTWEGYRLRGRLAQWEVQMIAWKQRFYCARCDATFTPVPTTAGPYTGQTVRWPAKAEP